MSMTCPDVTHRSSPASVGGSSAHLDDVQAGSDTRAAPIPLPRPVPPITSLPIAATSAQGERPGTPDLQLVVDLVSHLRNQFSGIRPPGRSPLDAPNLPRRLSAGTTAPSLSDHHHTQKNPLQARVTAYPRRRHERTGGPPRRTGRTRCRTPARRARRPPLNDGPTTNANRNAPTTTTKPATDASGSQIQPPVRRGNPSAMAEPDKAVHRTGRPESSAAVGPASRVDRRGRARVR